MRHPFVGPAPSAIRRLAKRQGLRIIQPACQPQLTCRAFERHGAAEQQGVADIDRLHAIDGRDTPLARRFPGRFFAVTSAEQQHVAKILEKNAEVMMTNTHLEEMLVVRLVAALLGVFNGFRVTRLPEPERSAAAQGRLVG